ncbi:MAG: hypothetical protein JJU45_07370 [Acidimicrobiia bacterium]|nr:hypothetical protein [Acidimicrobiia bacterium]
MNTVPALVVAQLLPESVLGTQWFALLATFVAVNTILYVSMSIFKLLPKPYLSDFVRRHGRRAETRSIFPDRYPDGRRRPTTTVDPPTAQSGSVTTVGGLNPGRSSG